jgi:Holliday junction resolvase RusA-like endonuclease
MTTTTTRQQVTFTIYGEPKPAGSKKAFPFRRPDGSLGVRVTHDNPQSRSWMQEVSHAARLAMEGKLVFAGAVSLVILFERPRPKSHYCKRGLSVHGLENPYPTSRPDADKLARAVADAMTGVVYDDDSQICDRNIRKRWGQDGYRTVVIVTEMEDEAF